MIVPDSIRIFNSGYCTQNEYLAGGKRWRTIRFAALFVAFEHSQLGHCLIDTGYSPQFHIATQRFPGRLHRWFTPTYLDPRETPDAILTHHGIDPAKVNRIYVSHFHADHIGGNRHFPNAQFIARKEAWDYLASQKPLGQVKNGFLANLLPEDFSDRTEFLAEGDWDLEKKLGSGKNEVTFQAHDTFGDGSLLLIDLPGHAVGHMGFLFQRPGQESLFYIVDAAWFMSTIREQKRLPRISMRMQHDRQQYLETQAKLQQLIQEKDVKPFACHCPDSQRLAENPIEILHKKNGSS